MGDKTGRAGIGLLKNLLSGYLVGPLPHGSLAYHGGAVRSPYSAPILIVDIEEIVKVFNPGRFFFCRNKNKTFFVAETDFFAKVKKNV